MSNIDVRTIVNDVKNNSQNTLSGTIFVVKDYQRGYRWGESQIRALLNDIYNFDTHDGKLKYCLQPLVVKRMDMPTRNVYRLSELLKQKCVSNSDRLDNNIVWELIDGQQRLTTALLILNACYNVSRNPKPIPYDVVYVNQREIDRHYIEKAIQIIDDWFGKFDEWSSDDAKSDIQKKLHSCTQFIWYEIDQSANSSDVFTKLNMGKIPLTNAELFKALLLGKEGKDIAKISIEWDVIEQSLRDNEFWYFISNQYNDSTTRIDYLLKIFALNKTREISTPPYENDTLFSFEIVDSLINEGKMNAADIWEQIVKIYDTLKEWYENKELYHRIGYLIYVKTDPFKTINSLIYASSVKNKTQFKTYVQEEIKSQFSGLCLDDLDYDNATDKKRIKNVLLLFNVFTMIKSKTESKFSFKQFKSENWDIEHIHAKATDEQLLNAKKTEQIELLLALKNQLQEINDVDAILEIEKFINGGSSDSNEFLKFYNKISNKYGNFYENGICNLVLLDSTTNREYKNSLFAHKRQRIIERDKGEVFIPVCTKNVFLKLYSGRDGLANMLQWNCTDAQDYLCEMKKVLTEDAQLCLSEKE